MCVALSFCDTTRVSQLLARHECGIEFGVQGGDECAEAVGGQSIQQWALNVISGHR